MSFVQYIKKEDRKVYYRDLQLVDGVYSLEEPISEDHLISAIVINGKRKNSTVLNPAEQALCTGILSVNLLQDNHFHNLNRNFEFKEDDLINFNEGGFSGEGLGNVTFETIEISGGNQIIAVDNTDEIVGFTLMSSLFGFSPLTGKMSGTWMIGNQRDKIRCCIQALEDPFLKLLVCSVSIVSESIVISGYSSRYWRLDEALPQSNLTNSGFGYRLEKIVLIRKKDDVSLPIITSEAGNIPWTPVSVVSGVTDSGGLSYRRVGDVVEISSIRHIRCASGLTFFTNPLPSDLHPRGTLSFIGNRVAGGNRPFVLCFQDGALRSANGGSLPTVFDMHLTYVI